MVSRRRRQLTRAPTARRKLALPCDAVVLPVVGGAAPKGAVLPVEENGVDGARRAVLEVEPVSHLAQVTAHPGRRVGPQSEPAGLRLVVAERVPHLVARDVR